MRRHLANIYVKLGVGSRTAAAAWAHEHGLPPRPAADLHLSDHPAPRRRIIRAMPATAACSLASEDGATGASTEEHR